MNKKYTLGFVLLIGLVLGLASCTKYSFMSYRKKIVGTWRFDKVTHKAGLFKQSVDITRNYENWTYEFKENNTVLARNANTGEQLQGAWWIDQYTDYYYEEDGTTSSSTDYVLRFDLSSSTQRTNYVWNIGSITAKYLRASEYIGNERWNYKMSRI
ncbi:hypothetical protein DBR32_02015 [Taibaiella sp. KBW10]|uniref:hypothetical protein n=1 Tax=Taibaiella sp. KBW10 TaxID=2153357 RepID=UPI000F58FB5C|nr:hypothetical protein [Taibaiella sp. KBW10]RQO32404.1 hypothetical protein DBR32_02015 [Taibaiella sp. KBW10]